jgi:hypothetical protein
MFKFSGRYWLIEAGYQILLKDENAQIMQIILAIFVSLVWPYIFKIIRRFWVWVRLFWSWVGAKWHTLGQDEQDEAQGLLPREHVDPARTLNRSHSARKTVSGFIKTILLWLKGEEKPTASQWTTIVVIATIIFMAFVAHTLAGVFSTRVATDRAALSSSKYCGIWMIDDRAGQEAAERDDLLDYAKEYRAGQYAQNCYNTPNSGYANGCEYFYNQSIAYSLKTQQPCPFRSPELCYNGLYSAVTFDTGYVDASVIGINSPIRYQFRRRSICSPLNMSEPYIQPIEGESNEISYHYYYGSTDRSDYTFNTSGTPFEWLLPVYSLK